MHNALGEARSRDAAVEHCGARANAVGDFVVEVSLSHLYGDVGRDALYVFMNMLFITTWLICGLRSLCCLLE